MTPTYYSSQIFLIILFLLLQVFPIKELNSQGQEEEKKQHFQSQERLNFEASPKWQKLESDKESSEKLIIWDKIEIKNDVKVNNFLLNNHKDLLLRNSNLENNFRSSSRSLIYKDYLYPEMSFWIPSSFKHSKRFTYTATAQLLGNPTIRNFKDYCSWEEFWKTCSDGQYFLEATPINTKYFSLGVNYSQQESFLGSRNDGGWKDGGQSLGFQLKTNLNSSQGISIIGNNLYNIYGGGGPNMKHPNEQIYADLGRSYLFLYSKAWDLGNYFNSKSPSLINLNAGFGNGRYKSAKEIAKYWINLGKFEPIYSLGFALNQKISFFTEYAGQYAGIGISLRPFKMPLTATFMLRDFKGSNQGIINCKDGNPDNCRATIDSRLVFHF